MELSKIFILLGQNLSSFPDTIVGGVLASDDSCFLVSVYILECNYNLSYRFFCILLLSKTLKFHNWDRHHILLMVKNDIL